MGSENRSRSVESDTLRQQEMLASFAEAALRSTDLEQIMFDACDHVRYAVGADMVLLHRLSTDGQRLRVCAGVGIEREHIGAEIRRRNDLSLESRLLRDGETVVVPDVTAERRLESRNLLLSFGQRGLALIALLDGPARPMLGHLHISTRRPRDFAPELPFLRIYASLVATSIMRVEARQQQAREEEARHRSEQQLRAVLDGIPQLVWSADGEANWTWAGPQWHGVTGLSEAASRGLHWMQAIHPDDVAAVETAWQQAKDKGIFEVECRLWHRPLGTYRSYQGRGLPRREGDAMSWVGTFTDVEDLRALETRQSLLVAELQHRTRNMLAVVEGIATQTIRTSATMDDFEDSFHARLLALDRAQKLLAGTDSETTMHGLVEAELDALGVPVGSELVQCSGDEVVLPRSMVQMLALALHELGTNSRKYGVLANGGGHLKVDWSAENEQLNFMWAERFAAPLPCAPATPRRGFGRELIERALPHQLKATSSYQISSEAVTCHLRMPLRRTTATL